MNKSNLYSMQDRLAPDEQVVAQLMERLSAGEPAKKRRRPAVYATAAAAACLALAVLAVPLSRALSPASPRLHSYVTEDGVPGFRMETTAGGTEAGKDQPVLDPNTGEVPGGAYIGETIPVGEGADEDAINAYANLMAHFEAELGPDRTPDWYGGSYVLGKILIVRVVNSAVPEEYLMDAGDSMIPSKEFYYQIQEWAGNGQRTDAVGFSDAKYPLSSLKELQERVTALPQLKELDSWACGVDEMSNRVELAVPQAEEALLAALAELDPDDDAILVVTGSSVTTTAKALDGPVAALG